MYYISNYLHCMWNTLLMRPHLLNAKLTFHRLSHSNDKWKIINDKSFRHKNSTLISMKPYIATTLLKLNFFIAICEQ